MKKFSLFAALLLAGAAGAAWAQETTPADQTPAPAPAAPAAPQALFPAGSTAPRPVAPAAGTPAAGARGAGAGRSRGRNRRNSAYATDAAVLQANADPLEVRVAYRKDKTLALLRAPELIDLLQAADAARTDPQKREYLRAYYTKLYATVNKIDPSPAMKAHVALLAAASKQRYDPQRRSVSGEDDLAGVGRGGGRNRR